MDTMNDVLLSGNVWFVYNENGLYEVSLVNNMRVYVVKLNGVDVFRRGACWATDWEVRQLIGAT